MKKHIRAVNILSATIATLVLGVAPQAGWAEEEDEMEFAEAHLFFELNHTDGDLGIHALIDGDPWKQLRIEDKRERRMLDIKVKGRLRKQGLTEIFFESAEPSFDDLLPVEFFDRFPAGTYEIEGRTLDNEELENELELTHVMPAPPAPSVNGEPLAEVCDDEDPDYDAPMVSAPVIISWDEVATSHPDLGVDPQVPVTIHNYEVVVEVELEVEGEEFASVFTVKLPPGVTSMTIPDEFIAQGDVFKYEVLAREASYNQTAIESCFEVK